MNSKIKTDFILPVIAFSNTWSQCSNRIPAGMEKEADFGSRTGSWRSGSETAFHITHADWVSQKINNDLKCAALKSFEARRRSFDACRCSLHWQCWPPESGDVHEDLSELRCSEAIQCKLQTGRKLSYSVLLTCGEASKEVKGKMLAGILMKKCPTMINFPFLHLF